jgi:hypothetical protein
MHQFLFVLTPPYCGSTVLWRMLATSPAVSALPQEGQHLPAVAPILRKRVWDAAQPIDWATVRREWEKLWDLSRPILLEKSPPHLIRAAAIEKAFAPATFVAMMRNPYAFCEGYARRKNAPLAEAAAFWLRCAAAQQRNVATLERLLYFSYEEFTADPQALAQKIIAFMPALESLDAGGSYAARSIVSYEARPIQDLNALKIAQLSAGDVANINRVLEGRPELLDYFGYELVTPERARGLRQVGAQLALRARRAGRRLLRVGGRALGGLRPGESV